MQALTYLKEQLTKAEARVKLLQEMIAEHPGDLDQQVEHKQPKSPASSETLRSANRGKAATRGEIEAVQRVLRDGDMPRNQVEIASGIPSGRMSEIEEQLIAKHVIEEITGKDRYKVFHLPPKKYPKDKWMQKLTDFIDGVVAGDIQHDDVYLLEAGGMSMSNAEATCSHIKNGRYGEKDAFIAIPTINVPVGGPDYERSYLREHSEIKVCGIAIVCRAMYEGDNIEQLENELEVRKTS